MTILHWPERDVWKMTPYKITTLFKIHKEFHEHSGTQRAAPGGMADIDDALGGL